jgi:hypothetical protein
MGLVRRLRDRGSEVRAVLDDCASCSDADVARVSDVENDPQRTHPLAMSLRQLIVAAAPTKVLAFAGAPSCKLATSPEA